MNAADLIVEIEQAEFVEHYYVDFEIMNEKFAKLWESYNEEKLQYLNELTKRPSKDYDSLIWKSQHYAQLYGGVVNYLTPKVVISGTVSDRISGGTLPKVKPNGKK